MILDEKMRKTYPTKFQKNPKNRVLWFFLGFAIKRRNFLLALFGATVIVPSHAFDTSLARISGTPTTGVLGTHLTRVFGTPKYSGAADSGTKQFS